MEAKKHTEPLRIRSVPGVLPPLWDRKVIFVANLLGLFFGNDQETGVLREQVGPLETYGGRILPILGLLFHGPGSNLAVLEHPPNTDLLGYFRHDLGLELPEVAVLSHEEYRALSQGDPRSRPALARFWARLAAQPSPWLDGFVTDAVLERMARLLKKKTLSSLQASRRGNNKLLLHHFLVESGLPVFDTELAFDASQVPHRLAALRRQGYRRAAIKAQIGASGIGMVRVETESPVEIPPYLFFEGACLVQGWLDKSMPGVVPVGSPSVQLFLNEETLNLYDLTEQILSPESIHEGNIAPPPYLADDPKTRAELLGQAEAAGRWLHAQGYRGTASVDFHLIERRGWREIRICEINARVTGATYPAVLACHFMPGGAWLMRNLRFVKPLPGPVLLQALDGNNLLFRAGRAPGILPINFNTNRTGEVIKGQFLCLSQTNQEAEETLQRARLILPVQGEFDRD